jgi:preprotein translocase subunit SecF
MTRRLFSFAAAAALAVVPLAAAAQLSPGIQLTGTIDQSLNSGNAQIGQRVTVSNVHSQDNNINGAIIYGHVDDVQSASQGRGGKIEITWDKLRTRSGNSYALNARTVNMQVNTKNNTVNEAGGAIAGMIIGNILGKKLGTNAGGAVGAAGGYLYGKNAQQNVTIPANSFVTVQVLRAYRQSH